MNRVIALLIIAIAGGLFASCQSDSNRVAEGGIGGTGVTMGRVAQVGSVYVNGIHYNTDSANFTIDGESAKTLDDISVGMVVRVTGSKDNATATGIAGSVVYDSLLIGPVNIINDTENLIYDPSTNHLGVMRQTVLINADTVFEDHISETPILIDQLIVGHFVEVSGYPGRSNEILATRIALRSTPGTYKVTGTVGAIYPQSKTFTLGALIIDASTIPSSLPAEGSYVQVEGSIAPSGNSFTAESITPVETNALAPDGEELSIEGVINSGLDVATHIFVINGLRVDASLTPYSTNDIALAAGIIAKVKGTMDGTTLLAENIELEATNTARGEIGSALQTGAVDMGTNTVSLLGQTIHITNATIFESDRHGESTFSLTDLDAGDYLEAKVSDNNGILTARKLELDHPHAYNASLEGIASDLGDNVIEILGVRIDIRGVSGYVSGSNQRIEVKGTFDASQQTLYATSISVDD